MTASTTAATQLVSLLMSEHQLMARLASVKHYFLLDQGDFFIHFLDSAEAELTKPVGEISRARLQAKLDLALRQGHSRIAKELIQHQGETDAPCCTRNSTVSVRPVVAIASMSGVLPSVVT